MTDRHAGYVVVLEEDLSEGVSSHVIDAIWQLKGVKSVEPVIAEPGIQIAEERAWWEWWERLSKNLTDHREERDGKK